MSPHGPDRGPRGLEQPPVVVVSGRHCFSVRQGPGLLLSKLLCARFKLRREARKEALSVRAFQRTRRVDYSLFQPGLLRQGWKQVKSMCQLGLQLSCISSISYIVTHTDQQFRANKRPWITQIFKNILPLAVGVKQLASGRCSSQAVCRQNRTQSSRSVWLLLCFHGSSLRSACNHELRRSLAVTGSRRSGRHQGRSQLPAAAAAVHL